MPKLKDTEMFKRMPLPKECSCCPNTGSLTLTAMCHVGAPVFAILAGDILTLECGECRKVVTRLEVTCEVRMK